MKTCVSLNCPFIPYCKNYNFLVDRGERCEIQEDILYRAGEFEQCKKKKATHVEIKENDDPI